MKQGIRDRGPGIRACLPDPRSPTPGPRPRGPNPRAPYVVGIGGQAGSGKSLVARVFAEQGTEVIDADRIGWSLLERTAPTFAKVVRAFGQGILDESGNVDRKKLGAIVFKDKDAMARLNRIVHPGLLAELRRRAWAPVNPRLEPLSPARIRVIDAALLFFWGWQRKVDCSVVVTASRKNKLARLMKSGLSRDAARRRLDSQLPEAEMVKLADFEVPNDGTLDELEHESSNAWAVVQVLSMAKAKWG